MKTVSSSNVESNQVTRLADKQTNCKQCCFQTSDSFLDGLYHQQTRLKFLISYLIIYISDGGEHIIMGEKAGVPHYH